jgi:two-component system, NarL family, nitrate/nitrite response regulator NarL
MRVLLCDDHRLLSDCIASVFEELGHVVELASNPAEAVEFLSKDRADICILDLGFPKSGGDPVTFVRQGSPTTPIVVFTGSSDPVVIQQARNSGARGYVSKGDSLDRLVEVVEHVMRDRDGDADWDIRPAAAHGSAERSPYFLTPRELQALEGLVQGKNTSELAQWMGVRESTVSTHVQTVLAKLGVHSRLEAVAFAMANRLVTIDR